MRKVEYDLSRGETEKARQRLTGLLCHYAYPMNLQIRRMLGDIHWHKGNKIEAGRYWYLEEHKTPEMTAACKRYEKACGHSKQTILRRLKLMGDIATLRDVSPYAYDVIQQLSDGAWNDFETRHPAGNFYDSVEWEAQKPYQLRPQTHHILIIDGIGKLSKTAITLTVNIFGLPRLEQGLSPEKNISVFTLAAQKLSRIIHEARYEKIEFDNLDLIRLDNKLAEATKKHGMFEAAVVWLPGEMLDVHTTIAQHINGRYFHVLGKESYNPEQPITTPYATFKHFPNVSYHQIVLGWFVEQDSSRWLVEDEIAVGVAAAMRYNHTRWKVGTITPWQNRPV